MADLFEFFEEVFPSTPEGFFAQKHLSYVMRQGLVRSSAVGADGVRRPSFRARLEEETALISRKVLGRSYSFTRYKERLILRGPDRKPRQISIPTMRDRLALRAACSALKALFPAAIPSLPHAHIKAISALVRGADEPQAFVRIDIKDFYPSVRHDILEMMLRKKGVPEFLLEFLMKAVRTGTGVGAPPNTIGIPQGLSVSNILSAIYLSEYDEKLPATASRYVDDILIVCPPSDARKVLDDEIAKLADLGLVAHELSVAGKTTICPTANGIEYLGYGLDPSKISIRSSSYERMFKNLLRVITKYKHDKNLEKFIFKLNLKITGCFIDKQRRGWLLFFSQTEDISQLRFLDSFVTKQLNRLGVREEQSRIKRFTKCYHEIRFRGIDSNYIPNFDNYTSDDKKEYLLRVVGTSESTLAALDELTLSELFKTHISREIQDLERDVIGAIS